MTVHLVHSGHDAEHQRPDENRKEHSARCNTSKTNTAYATAGDDDERTEYCHSGPYRP